MNMASLGWSVSASILDHHPRQGLLQPRQDQGASDDSHGEITLEGLVLCILFKFKHDTPCFSASSKYAIGKDSNQSRSYLFDTVDATHVHTVRQKRF